MHLLFRAIMVNLPGDYGGVKEDGAEVPLRRIKCHKPGLCNPSGKGSTTVFVMIGRKRLNVVLTFDIHIPLSGATEEK